MLAFLFLCQSLLLVFVYPELNALDYTEHIETGLKGLKVTAATEKVLKFL